MYKILSILLSINKEGDLILCFINKQHSLKFVLFVL